MIPLERVIVSRKTPSDGRLLISEATALRLAEAGPGLVAAHGAARTPARLLAARCSCGKASGVDHVHHYLESAVLAGLTPQAEVALVLDANAAVLRVEDADPSGTGG